MSDTCLVDGKTLRLNGVGYRKLFMVKVYKASLYTATRVTAARELYRFESPVRIHFEYVYGPIDRTRIANAWQEALSERMAPEIEREQFLATITEYQKGDTVHYDLLPNGELHTYKNERETGVFASRPLCVSVLDIIFGDKPIDARMKADLLASDAQQSEAVR